MAKPAVPKKMRKLTDAEIKRFAKLCGVTTERFLFHTNGGMVFDEKSGYDHSGCNNPRYGTPHTQETKDKISKATKGRKISQEHSQRNSEAQAKYWTDERKEQRRKESLARGSKPPSPKGMRWWTDGSKNQRAKEQPGPEWKIGRIGRYW